MLNPAENSSDNGTPNPQADIAASIPCADLPAMATALERSGQYRVLRKYERPSYYSTDDGTEKRTAVFLDVETTGSNPAVDKIIQLSMVAFTFSKDGRIFELIDEFDAYEDPQMPIPEEITDLTGITDAHVAGQKIDEAKMEEFLSNAALVIAHNAQFDRPFVEKRFSIFGEMPWACSINDVQWREEGLESSKLEFLAYKCGFFYDAHRAIQDCLASVHVLAHRLPKSKGLVLGQLLENARKTSYRIWAIDSPYQKKDLLKKGGYRWNNGENGQPKAWYIEVFDDALYQEKAFLEREIYGIKQSPRIDQLDAYNRYSLRP